MARKIKGVYCERTATPRKAFDGKSFRWIKRGTTWLIIGCPRGKWQPRKERCKVGTRAYKILSRTRKGKRCPVGDKRVRK